MNSWDVSSPLLTRKGHMFDITTSYHAQSRNTISLASIQLAVLDNTNTKKIMLSCNVERKYSKSLQDFLKQFNKARFQTKNYSHDIILTVLVNNICYTHLRLFTGKRKPTSLDKFCEHI